MKEIAEQVFDEIRSAWRFRWWGIGLAGVISLLGAGVAMRMPEHYVASASVFVDTHSLLGPAIRDLALEQDVTAQINYVRQSLLSGEALEKVAADTGVLSPGIADEQQRTAVLSAMEKRVDISVRAGAGDFGNQDVEGAVYTVTYADAERGRALRVADTLLSTLVEDTLGGKREGSQDASAFLMAQIKDYEERLRDAETKLADFKKNNIGLMPTEQGGYFNQLQTETDAAKQAESDLAVALSRRDELARQLRGETVLGASAMSSVGRNGGGTDTLSRITETQVRLDELLLRFTDRHPDVIATRATLAELKQRREQELDALRRGDTSAAAVSGITSNPVYQSIQLQLNQADVEIASLRGRLAQRREKAAELRMRLDTAPQVEAEYAELMRDYDFNREQYTALMANYEKVRLGASADDAGSVRFRIVQQPTAPYAPSSNRLLILAATLVGALVAGGLLCYALHLTWPVVISARDLSSLTDLPILGVVSAAFPQRLQVAARGEYGRFLLAIFLLLGFFVTVFALDRAGFGL